ncbi:uncharacterized protein LOC115246289 [Formica exsecta]|uniref:uncharacterized protein LOC115246289 n=1 Tax=Formica exsecta TaxID=72781 RepID=UPI001141238F|nr:uncharacterized protein LOC115246289 [Formica exsecta]
MLADHDTWHKMKNMALMQNCDNRFLEFLACSKYYINEYLELITPHNGTYIGIQAKNCINSFLYIIAKHAKHDYVFMNILTNFEKLKPKDISALATLTIIINHVYSKKQLDEIKNTITNIIEKYAFDHITEILYKENKTYEILCAII